MAARILKTSMFGSKRITIAVAQVVHDKGFKRPVELLDQTILQQTAQDIANAAGGSILRSSLTDEQMAATDQIEIT